MEMNLNCDFSEYNFLPLECRYVGGGCIKVSVGFEGEEEVNVTLKITDAEKLIKIIQENLDEIGY